MKRLESAVFAGLACPAMAFLLGIAASVRGQDAVPRAGLQLWIRADSVKVESGKVTQLYDLSGKNNHPMHESLNGMDPLSPALVPNANNGHPTLRFNNKFTGFAFANIADIRTVIAVLAKDSASCLPTLPNYKTPAKFFLGQSDNNTNFHPEHGCSLYNANLSEVSPLLVNGKTYVNGKQVADGRKTFFPFKLGLVTMIPTGNVKASTVARDRTNADRSWQGDISEILIYNVPLDDAARDGVEKYLMGKYGINGVVGIRPRQAGVAGLPQAFRTAFAYVRPYASGMELSFSSAGSTLLVIRDWNGRRIRSLMDSSLPAGDHSVQWNGSDDAGRRVSPGVYVAELETRGGRLVNRAQHVFFLR